ncbi:MAG: 50S ribosomal protein L1 [Candidatus Falkowbacteria bacterium]|nr:50S ribosomal protein L1 [Candidatus Falkowbacteria bacterium]
MKNTKVKTVKKVVVEFDRFKKYSIEEAIDLVKKTSKTKFDASVEVHIKTGIDPKKGDQQVRGGISLPHGTGKVVRVAAFVTPDKIEEVKKAGADVYGGEELIAEIKKTEKTDFEVAVAEPLMMPKLAQIAKILGTRGLMPSPKNETVGLNPFDSNKLIENYKALMENIAKAKPTTSKGTFIHNITICSSMGPGIKVQ